MCIYVEFENNKVFVAHMVAYTWVDDDSPSSDDSDYYEVRQEQFPRKWEVDSYKGQQLKEALLRQLESELGVLSSAVRKAFAVCPAILRTDEEQQSAGWWMIEAVREFLKLSDIELKEGHGFAAGPGIEPVLFNFAESDPFGGELPPEHYDWKAANKPLAKKNRAKGTNGPWEFQYYEGDWHTYT